MASSGNFAVFSTVTRPESPYSTSDQITGGGLSIKGPGSGSFEPVIATISPSSGKWYWEYRAGQGGGSSFGRPAIAVSEQGVVKNEDFTGGASGQTGVLFTVNDGGKRINNSDTSYGNAVSQHDIVQIALDCDNGAVYLGINNTWQNSGNPESGSSKTGAALTSGIQNVGIDIIHTRYVGGGIDQYNFGQDDTFGGAITGAGNTDGNGRGAFKYAPPTGFLALCSANLPTASGIDPNLTDDNYPGKQFNCLAYTGTGSSNAVSGLGFQPDLVVIKNRSGTQGTKWTDSSRGATKVLQSAVTNAESTDTGGVTAFGSDGFTVGNDAGYNGSSNDMIAWCWRANGGTTATNTQGTITSSVQANQDAGFSIVTYTGDGNGGATFGHGLSAKPSFVIIKNRDDGSQKWAVWHQAGNFTDNQLLFLNSNQAVTTEGTQRWDVSAISSSVFGLGSHNEINGSNTDDYVAYIWHDVEGFQKFSKYTGNGNADGPFVYLGFRPRLLMIKRNATDNWFVFDTARDTVNVMGKYLLWDVSQAEAGSNLIDFYSTGFKLRTSSASLNPSGNEHFYAAWGDIPAKYNNTR